MSVYITVKQSPMYHQMTLEELLFQDYKVPTLINTSESNTRTCEFDYVSEHFTSKVDVGALIAKLTRYNESTEQLRQKKRPELYHSFYIPKKSGGLRHINAPEAELMDALRRQKNMYEQDFHVLYHTSAFAYIKNRCTVDAVKRHQSNESKWFAKLDLRYCYERGFHWIEESSVSSSGYVDLYEILDRVSCWCCTNKNLKELKNIYQYLPQYWEKLKELQRKIERPYKGCYKGKPRGVFELEERFSKELRGEANA